MKKIISLILVSVMLLGLCACGSGNSAAGKPDAAFRVGYGREKIMPDGPVAMSGGGDPNRISTNVKDFLYVTCVAITDETDNTVLIFTQDLQSTSTSFSKDAVEQIVASTGVPKENILIAATHNHSGPAQSVDRTGIAEFKTIYTAGMVRAAQTAMADRAAATMEAGSLQADGYVFTRHYKMMDGTYAGSSYGNLVEDQIESHAYDADTTLQMVRFVREGKKPVLMMNLGAHATFFSSTKITDLSADFPSPLRTYIESNSDCLVAYFIGAAGDQTPNSKFKPSDHNLDYKGYGQAVGKLVVDGLTTLQPVNTGNIKLQHMNYTATVNKKGTERLPQAKDVYDVYLADGYSAGNQAAYAAGFISVYDARSIVNRAKMPATENIALAALAIGDVAFIYASFEMFGDAGRYIRQNSPYEHTFISTLALEAGHDYIPSDIGFELNCYEAYTAFYEQDTIKGISQVYLDTLKTLKGE